MKERYVICINPEQARKDARDRQIIVEALREKLRSGDKALVGSSGYREYLQSPRGGVFSIDEEKVAEESLFDGKWVLRTNSELSAPEVALKYKQLWMVEDLFPSVKSVVETRPIYHQTDEAIRGHVFCSFLALVVLKELQVRLIRQGLRLEGKRVIHDVQALQEVEKDHQTYYLRTELRGCWADVFRAVGVVIPPTVFC